MCKILIIVCSSTINRGTEALIRGTINILNDSLRGKNVTYTLASSSPEDDQKENLPYVGKYISRTDKTSGFINKVIKKLRQYVVKGYDAYHDLLKIASVQDLIIVVGADNYDVAYHMYNKLHYLNKKLKESCKGKLILYDCSLNVESVNEQFISEMELFDLVTIRESITKNNLLNKMQPKNLFFFPDPAFSMSPEKVSLPNYWKSGKMIGINLSTLIVSKEYGSNLKEKVTTSYLYLINKILSETDYDIVFIPHVMKGADLNILQELYSGCINKSRIHIIENENLTATQLKYIISKCDLFLGARTHATIAAYSSCVPTLVLGYSVKSIGIATDLFGTSKGWVVPVQTLNKKEELWNSFEKILNNKESIKKQLENVMPKYILKSQEFGHLVKQLLVDKVNE